MENKDGKNKLPEEMQEYVKAWEAARKSSQGRDDTVVKGASWTTKAGTTDWGVTTVTENTKPKIR